MVMLVAGIYPATFTGWIAIFLFSLPLWLFFSWLGERMFSERISRRIDASEKAFSFRRMVYVLFVVLVTGGTVAAVIMFTKDFWGPLFSRFWPY
jgi:hypothetical protein